MVAITQEDGVRGRRKGRERSPGSCMNSVVKYTPDVEGTIRSFSFLSSG